MLQGIARLAIAAPRRVLVAAASLTAALAIFGIPVAKGLSSSGFQDPTSESSLAAQLLAGKFGQGDVQMLVTVSASGGIDSAAARAAGTDILTTLRNSPHVVNLTSPWTVPPPAAAALMSKDRTVGLITAGIEGSENQQQIYARELSDQLNRDRDGVKVQTGGLAMLEVQITEQSRRDLLVMESIAIPLSFLVLVWVFGGLWAAALPVSVGVMAIVGALSVLRVTSLFTDVSIFALNLTAAMGLALAIDYTLLMISRFRSEVGDGADRDTALIRMLMTAGRTVVFSATTVAMSMAVMVLFPMHFLKSFAYAGVATVGFAALAALVVTPAALVLLGHRLEALDVRRLVRSMLARPEPASRSVDQLFWYRWTKVVLRHAVALGLAGVTVLVVVGLPFLGVKWGYPDDRVLPTSLSVRQVGETLRTDFASNSEAEIPIVVPDSGGVTPGGLERYAGALSRVPDVAVVSAPSGAFVAGSLVGPPVAPAGQKQGSAFLIVSSNAPLFSDRSEAQLDRLHAVPAPAPVEFGGIAQINRDSVEAITSRLPVVLGLIAVIMLVLLFLLTGSIVLPLKALVLNVLSLSAAFGVMVWIFQDGHLGGLGTTATDTLIANIPVLLFCIAFGLSMDYEVFLVSRIREFWLASGSGSAHHPDPARAHADNDESVALGIAHTGRVVTAAALVMSISFAALIAANVAFMRMFGLGLTLAVLVDATLTRMVLVPAFMHVAGRWNWWAPAPLVTLHHRLGLDDGQPGAKPERLRAAAPDRQ